MEKYYFSVFTNKYADFVEEQEEKNTGCGRYTSH